MEGARLRRGRMWFDHDGAMSSGSCPMARSQRDCRRVWKRCNPSWRIEMEVLTGGGKGEGMGGFRVESIAELSRGDACERRRVGGWWRRVRYLMDSAGGMQGSR